MNSSDFGSESECVWGNESAMWCGGGSAVDHFLFVFVVFFVFFKGLKRTSVFERLGAESKADTANSTEVGSVAHDPSLCKMSVNV